MVAPDGSDLCHEFLRDALKKALVAAFSVVSGTSLSVDEVSELEPICHKEATSAGGEADVELSYAIECSGVGAAFDLMSEVEKDLEGFGTAFMTALDDTCGVLVSGVNAKAPLLSMEKDASDGVAEVEAATEDSMEIHPLRRLLRRAGNASWLMQSESLSRRLEENPDFRGSYCAVWDDGDAAPWCFVRPECGCGPRMRSASGDSKSEGPCAGSVESRSLLVPKGLELLHTVLHWGIVVGLLLLAVAASSFWLFKHPAKYTRDAESLPRKDRYGPDSVYFTALPSKTQDSMFREAQIAAGKGLKETTSESIRLAIYSFFMQATQGDITEERSEVDRREQRKYDAWESKMGLTRVEAMEGYIQAVALL